MKVKTKDVLICGAALFAIFFGAGNTIFPPHIGIVAGDRWWEAMLAFLLSDPLLPILGVIVTVYLGGRADDLGKRVSPGFAKTIGTLVILIIGPFFAVPRTGAVTHEILVQPNFPGVPLWVTSAIFFAVTLIIVLYPSKVIDIIGKYLTPALLLLIGLIIGKAILSPPDAMVDTGVKDVFKLGFTEGYQTMDAIGSPLMAGIVITDLVRRGYTNRKEQLRASWGIGLVAALLLALVYGGLTLAGATVGGHFDANTERVALLIGMVELMLGSIGKIVMGIVIALACLTTSTGLISTCGNYFSTISAGKLPYKTVAVIATIIAFVVSLNGVDQIIKVAVPILIAIYPGMIVLIVMSAFDKWIKYNLTYTGAVVGAYFVSIVQALDVAGQSMVGRPIMGELGAFVDGLPFKSITFQWLVPAIIGGVIFTIFAILMNKQRVKKDNL